MEEKDDIDDFFDDLLSEPLFDTPVASSGGASTAPSASIAAVPSDANVPGPIASSVANSQIVLDSSAANGDDRLFPPDRSAPGALEAPADNSRSVVDNADVFDVFLDGGRGEPPSQTSNGELRVPDSVDQAILSVSATAEAPIDNVAPTLHSSSALPSPAPPSVELQAPSSSVAEQPRVDETDLLAMDAEIVSTYSDKAPHARQDEVTISKAISDSGASQMSLLDNLLSVPLVDTPAPSSGGGYSAPNGGDATVAPSGTAPQVSPSPQSLTLSGSGANSNVSGADLFDLPLDGSGGESPPQACAQAASSSVAVPPVIHSSPAQPSLPSPSLQSETHISSVAENSMDGFKDLHEPDAEGAPQDDANQSKAKTSSWSSRLSSFSKGAKKYGALAKRAIAEDVQMFTDEARKLGGGLQEGVSLAKEDSKVLQERVATVKTKAWQGMLSLGSGAGNVGGNSGSPNEASNDQGKSAEKTAGASEPAVDAGDLLIDTDDFRNF